MDNRLEVQDFTDLPSPFHRRPWHSPGCSESYQFPKSSHSLHLPGLSGSTELQFNGSDARSLIIHYLEHLEAR